MSLAGLLFSSWEKSMFSFPWYSWKGKHIANESLLVRVLQKWEVKVLLSTKCFIFCIVISEFEKVWLLPLKFLLLPNHDASTSRVLWSCTCIKYLEIFLLNGGVLNFCFTICTSYKQQNYFSSHSNNIEL